MSRGRRHLVLVACAAIVLMMLMFQMVSRSPLEPLVPAGTVPKGGIAGVVSAPAAQNTPAPPAAPRAVTPARVEAPPMPFTFLGKVKEGGGTSVILFRSGRTFTVRGPGRLDENYEVEAIQDDLLLLRYLPLGERQVLELSAMAMALPPGNSAAETAQD